MVRPNKYIHVALIIRRAARFLVEQFFDDLNHINIAIDARKTQHITRRIIWVNGKFYAQLFCAR